jgi:hypothetical protein
MKTITFNFQYDTDGNIIYGPQPDGLFLISGEHGPELRGYPNIPVVNGLQFTVNDDGSYTPLPNQAEPPPSRAQVIEQDIAQALRKDTPPATQPATPTPPVYPRPSVPPAPSAAPTTSSPSTHPASPIPTPPARTTKQKESEPHPEVEHSESPAALGFPTFKAEEKKAEGKKMDSEAEPCPPVKSSESSKKASSTADPKPDQK